MRLFPASRLMGRSGSRGYILRPEPGLAGGKLFAHHTASRSENLVSMR
jgi:hypothetical protein